MNENTTTTTHSARIKHRIFRNLGGTEPQDFTHVLQVYGVCAKECPWVMYLLIALDVRRWYCQGSGERFRPLREAAELLAPQHRAPKAQSRPCYRIMRRFGLVRISR